jgi:hypothetical protein
MADQSVQPSLVIDSAVFAPAGLSSIEENTARELFASSGRLLF